MSDIQVTCTTCGQVFGVTDQMGGLLAVCPNCSKQVSVPMSSRQLESKSSVHVKRDANVDGGLRCPSCGMSLPNGAVLCVQCGYDTRIGVKRVITQGGHRPLQMALWVAGLVIVGGLVYTLWLKPSRTSAPVVQPAPASPVAEAPAPVSEPPAESALSAPAEPSVPVAGVVTDAVTSAVATTTSVVVAEESDESAAQREADLRQKVEIYLDRTQPRFAVGEAVALRRANGIMHRGVYEGVSSTNAVLGMGTNRVDVPFMVLDQPSRLRCDEAFRSKWIEYQVQRQTRESGKL